MHYKAGETYTMKVVIELDITPEKDCDDEVMVDFVVDQLLRCDDVMSNISECECVSDKSGFEDTEENPPVKIHDPEDAVQAWEDLFPTSELEAKGMEVPTLTCGQIQFIKDALDSGYTIRRYSGRGMFGRECPGVSVESMNGPAFSSVDYQWDQLGKGYIIYVP